MRGAGHFDDSGRRFPVEAVDATVVVVDPAQFACLVLAEQVDGPVGVAGPDGIGEGGDGRV